MSRDQLREVVEQASGARLVTDPVIHQTAALLDDVLTVMAHHGITVAPGKAGDVAALCLTRVTRQRRATIPARFDGAAPLIEALRQHLTALGETCLQPSTRWWQRRTSTASTVIVSAREGTPSGLDGPANLAVALHPERGWVLYRDQPTTQMVTIEAPYTLDGARAVAQIVSDLVRGYRADPFGPVWTPDTIESRT